MTQISFAPIQRIALAIVIALAVCLPAVGDPVTNEQTRERLSELEAGLSDLVANIDQTSALLEAQPVQKQLNDAIIDLDETRVALSELESAANRIRERADESIDAVRPLLSGGVDSSASEGESQPQTDLLNGASDEALRSVLAPVQEIRARASVIAAEARLAGLEATRLGLALTELRDQTFLTSTIDRGRSPLSIGVWTTAIPRTIEAVGDVGRGIMQWRAGQIERGAPAPLLIMIAVIALTIVALIMLNARYYRWQVRQFSERTPTRQAVATAAMSSFLLRLSLAIGAVGVVALTAHLIGVLDSIPSHTAANWGLIAVAVISARALVESVMAPRTAAFRLIGIGDTGARAACTAFVSLVIVFAVQNLFETTGAMTSPGPEVNTAGALILSVLTAGLLCWLALKLEPSRESRAGFRRRAGRFLLALLGIGILVASLAGYSTLARYLVERLVLISFVLLVAILTRELVRATALQVLSGVVERRRYEATLTDEDDAETESASAIQGEFWVRIIVDALILIALPAFILLALGMPPLELWQNIRRLVAGVEVGGQRISLGNVFSAFLTLASVLLATRLVQRGLQKNILPHTQISSGASNSLITLLGYAGVIVAVIAAISVIGFDLSSLAIIAGALSVGIGFGLQSIVSNFVAGLILLFERPFKIGDWIVTPSGEGTVRKINVRATEVETFDRQSVIVPNAELVSHSFGNWTHKSEVMRIIVAVGVKYGTDPRKVEELLLEAATNVPMVRDYPPAYVVFKQFGDSALQFELRGYIVADDIVIAPSELRYEITRIFQRENITIPFPQRDLHVAWPKRLQDEAEVTSPSEPDEDTGRHI